MAVFAVTDASLTVNSVDLSDHVVSVGLDTGAAELDSTAMGDSWEEVIGGLKNWSLAVEFHQDFASSEVYATLFPLLGTLTTAVVKPTSGSVSSTNPSFTGSVFVGDLPILDSSVGDLATISVNWKGSGTLTAATS